MWKYVLFQVATKTLGRLPVRVAYFLAEHLADSVYLWHPRLRHRVWANMRHVMGERAPKSRLRRAAREVLRNTARYYVDLMRIPYLDVEKFCRQKLHASGLEANLLPAIAAGRGVILISGHFGSPELALQALLNAGIPVLGLTEPLTPRRLSKLVDGLRSSQGHTFLPVGVGAVKQVVRKVRSGGVVALMADRDIEGASITLPLFDADAKVPVGAFELAMRTGAMVVPIFAKRVHRDLFEAAIEPPLPIASTGDFQKDLADNVRLFLARLEEHLSRDPEQWIVLERVWENGADKRPSSQPFLVGSAR